MLQRNQIGRTISTLGAGVQGGHQVYGTHPSRKCGGTLTERPYDSTSRHIPLSLCFMLGKENVIALFFLKYFDLGVYICKIQLGVFVGYFGIICLITVKLVKFVIQTLTKKALYIRQ